jgi:hypothetical protein
LLFVVVFLTAALVLHAENRGRRGRAQTGFFSLLFWASTKAVRNAVLETTPGYNMAKKTPIPGNHQLSYEQASILALFMKKPTPYLP